MPATIVVGLLFGDEGKGSITDYLVRRTGAAAVVRFNGGPQAAHHVVTPDGREHTFAQFGSGTFVAGVQTLLSEHVLVNPQNLLVEERHLQQEGVTDALDRLTIDPGCVIVTPYHVLANRLRESARGDHRHGSCGEGVGEARGDQIAGAPTLYARDLRDPRIVWRVLNEIKQHKLAEFPDIAFDAFKMVRHDYKRVAERVAPVGEKLRLLFAVDADIVFEGAQGVLLDEDEGLGAPDYATWTDTTCRNALELIRPWDGQDIRRVGVVRAYATRHGPGPFPSESTYLSRVSALRDATNGHSEWQGPLRIGDFDLDLVASAERICPVDEIAVTCLDRITHIDSWAARADEALWPLKPTVAAYQRLLAWKAQAPLTIASFGPTCDDKVELLPAPRRHILAADGAWR